MKENTPIDINCVYQVPNTIHEGKEIYPNGSHCINYHTLLFSIVSDKLLRFTMR